MGLSFVAFALFVAGELAVAEPWRAPCIASAIALAAVAVSSTYTGAGKAQFRGRFPLFQPLKGGVRFVVLQIIGWTFFGLFITIPALPFVFATLYPTLAIEGLAVAAGAAAVLSEITVVTSLFFYRPHGPPASPSPADVVTEKHGLRAFLITESGKRWWTSFIGLQVLLTLVGLGLSVLADLVQHASWVWMFIGLFTVSCFALSAFLTYGVAGPWRHHLSEWKFYQPGIGGVKFVALQAFSWALFSIAMCIFGVHLFGAALQLQFPGAPVIQSPPSMVTGGIAGLLGELFLTASLFVFKSHAAAPVRAAEAPAQPALTRFIRLFLVVFFYNTQTIMGFLLCMSVVMAATWPNFVVYSWIAGFFVYGPTYLWNPSITGARAWRVASYQPLFDIVSSYFDLQIFSAIKGTRGLPMDDGERYIFGYHPHGLLPVSCSWTTSSSLFTNMFPNFRMAYLTARCAAASLTRPSPPLQHHARHSDDARHWASLCLLRGHAKGVRGGARQAPCRADGARRPGRDAVLALRHQGGPAQHAPQGLHPHGVYQRRTPGAAGGLWRDAAA